MFPRIPIPGTDSLAIPSFGVMLCLAFVLCTWFAARRAQRVGIAPQMIQDLVIWLFAGGLIGARIVYLVQEEHTGFWETIKRLPLIWQGGIVFYGSVFGGLVGYLGAWWFIFRKHRIPTLRLADVIAPAIALGLCLVLIGCLLNGCCYGQVACPDCAVYPTIHYPLAAQAREALVESGFQTAAGFTYASNQPGLDGVRVGQVVPSSPAWNSGLRPGDVIVAAEDHGIHTPEDLSTYLINLRNLQGKSALALTVQHPGAKAPSVLPPFTPDTLGLYPTQVYESISMVLLLLLALAYEPFRRREGQVMALVMMGYAFHRYLNELLRDDPRPIGFERYVSVLLFAAGLALWLWLQFAPLKKKYSTNEPALAAATADA